MREVDIPNCPEIENAPSNGWLFDADGELFDSYDSHYSFTAQPN